MPYQFNPHRHVKIWLSKNRDSFLNIENQLRLIRMRALNPKDTIHFIYDKRLLNENALAELKEFCKRYRIIRKNIPKHIIPNCQTKQEKQLIIDYQKEIENLQGSGNPAAASDILRWLSPVYNLGTYTDFDVEVDTRELGKAIVVNKPFLMNIGSVVIKENIESTYLNNDIIAIVDEQAALPWIQKVQEAIHNNYSLGYNPFQHAQLQQIRMLLNAYSRAEIESSLDHDQDFAVLSQIANLHDCFEDILALRQHIIKITANNNAYSENIAKKDCFDLRMFKKVDICHEVAQRRRNALKKQFNNSHLLSIKQYLAIKELIEADDHTLLTKMRENMRYIMLKTCVTYASGPMALLSTLFDESIGTSERMKEIIVYSMTHYGLEKSFFSKNSLPLHATLHQFSKLKNAEVGELADMSWLEKGENEMAKREQEIIEAALTLQRAYQSYKAR